MAMKCGGYIGRETMIKGKLYMPHGFNGVHISRFAVIGGNCSIYQNVTIGNINLKAPIIGNNCLIGCNSVILGGVKIGNNVKFGAGSIVVEDVPDNATVVPNKSRIILK